MKIHADKLVARGIIGHALTHTKEHGWSDSNKRHVVAHQRSSGRTISQTSKSGHARVDSNGDEVIACADNGKSDFPS